MELVFQKLQLLTESFVLNAKTQINLKESTLGAGTPTVQGKNPGFKRQYASFHHQRAREAKSSKSSACSARCR